ncbi:hypothetical protein S14_50 [Shewanella sp. phage 1/4]|uniref:hypothetical protein n=1 Tax=Shewanella phage 1/4 TaxID=1458859 RepID=UPI0004F5EAA0|nr:hypothetical protein S14_50 [Shewanella sp. phage 1/4]AHK11162.1 hypothetical protein S14_50 [Shewanella sp. phage 1/4]
MSYYLRRLKMLTAKEFNDLDGEFVVGDSTSTKSGSVYFKCLDEDGASYMNYSRDVKPDNYIVNFFAWRPLNTLPDNPKFKYEQDDDKGLWRPLLDQSAVKPSDDKPVFTQGMADAGELPPVGSEVLIKYHGDTEPEFCSATVEFVTYSNLGVVGVVNINGVNLTFDTTPMSNNMAEINPLDTRTPKQKAVDNAMRVIGHRVDLHLQAKNVQDLFLEAISEAVDAGLIKC